MKKESTRRITVVFSQQLSVRVNKSIDIRHLASSLFLSSLSRSLRWALDSMSCCITLFSLKTCSGATSNTLWQSWQVIVLVVVLGQDCKISSRWWRQMLVQLHGKKTGSFLILWQILHKKLCDKLILFSSHANQVFFEFIICKLCILIISPTVFFSLLGVMYFDRRAKPKTTFINSSFFCSNQHLFRKTRMFNPIFMILLKKNHDVKLINAYQYRPVILSFLQSLHSPLHFILNCFSSLTPRCLTLPYLSQ